MGHVALQTHMSFWLVSTLFRLMFSVILLQEIEKVLPLAGIPEHLRSWAWWFIALFGPFFPLVIFPEESPFGSMVSTTHFVLVMVLQVVAWCEVLGVVWGRNGRVWKAGMAVAIVGLIHPYTALATGVALALFVVWNAGWRKYIVWLFLIPAPVALIMLWSVFQPGTAAWRPGGVSYTPLRLLLLSWLPWIVLVVLRLRKRIRSDRPWLVWISVALGLAIIYPPVGRRFLDGIGIPISVLAFNWMSENWQRRWRWHEAGVTWGVMLTLAMGLLVNPVNARASYLPLAHVAMYEFLASRSGTGSVWGPDLDSNMIPAYTGWHVVNGHPDESPDFRLGLLRFRELCAGNWHASIGLRAWLVDRNVRYVVWPSYCQPFPLATWVVFRQGDVQVLKLK